MTLQTRAPSKNPHRVSGTFSFFDKQKFPTAETFSHLQIISENNVPLILLLYSVLYLSQKHFFLHIIFQLQIVWQKENQFFLSLYLEIISAN